MNVVQSQQQKQIRQLALADKVFLLHKENIYGTNAKLALDQWVLFGKCRDFKQFKVQLIFCLI